MIELDHIKVYAFVGPSGTGKSYRAQLVAKKYGLKNIIDDGLLVSENSVIAGESAKKAPTKIETVKKALFLHKEEKQVIIDAFIKNNVESVLILGTSDGMVKKIAKNLELPLPEKIVYITEFASQIEMDTAKSIRVTEGKHVIPVPTFEIKRDFSGFILDPLQIFKLNGADKEPYISEKSIIRPTFSYLGNYKISDTVFRQIAENVSFKIDGLHRLSKVRVESLPSGINIYMECYVIFGYNIISVLNDFKLKTKKEIERLTTMNILQESILAKGIHIPEREEI